MTRNEAITKATELWKKWISARPAVGIDGYLRQSFSRDDYRFYDLATIHESILQECRWQRTEEGKKRTSRGLQAEVRWELITLGKVRKALNE